MQPRELLRETIGLGIDDEIAIALLMQRNILGAMFSDCRKTQLMKKLTQLLRIARRIFYKLKAVGSDRLSNRSFILVTPLNVKAYYFKAT